MIKNLLVTEKNAREILCNSLWVTEASELRLLPGCWPKQIPTTLGNGQPFICTGVDDEKALYRQGNGCLTLKVFND